MAQMESWGPMHKAIPVAAVSLIVAAVAASGPARAETITFTTTLAGAKEVPPNTSAASGSALVSFDTDTMLVEWSISYQAQEAPLIGAHIHGPATAEANAGILVPLAVSASPIVGQAKLNEEQAAHLLDGTTYINLHSEKYPSGELRGQLTR